MISKGKRLFGFGSQERPVEGEKREEEGGERTRSMVVEPLGIEEENIWVGEVRRDEVENGGGSDVSGNSKEEDDVVERSIVATPVVDSERDLVVRDGEEVGMEMIEAERELEETEMKLESWDLVIEWMRDEKEEVTISLDGVSGGVDEVLIPKLPKLETLVLERCRLPRLAPRWLSGVAQLRQLAMVECGLSRVPPLHAVSGHLERLDLRGNALVDLSDFAPLPRLLALDVAGNALQSPRSIRALALFPKLGHVWLHPNPLTMSKTARELRAMVRPMCRSLETLDGSKLLGSSSRDSPSANKSLPRVVRLAERWASDRRKERSESLKRSLRLQPPPNPTSKQRITPLRQQKSATRLSRPKPVLEPNPPTSLPKPTRRKKQHSTPPTSPPSPFYSEALLRECMGELWGESQDEVDNQQKMEIAQKDEEDEKEHDFVAVIQNDRKLAQILFSSPADLAKFASGQAIQEKPSVPQNTLRGELPQNTETPQSTLRGELAQNTQSPQSPGLVEETVFEGISAAARVDTNRALGEEEVVPQNSNVERSASSENMDDGVSEVESPSRTSDVVHPVAFRDVMLAEPPKSARGMGPRIDSFHPLAMERWTSTSGADDNSPQNIVHEESPQNNNVDEKAPLSPEIPQDDWEERATSLRAAIAGSGEAIARLLRERPVDETSVEAMRWAERSRELCARLKAAKVASLLQTGQSSLYERLGRPDSTQEPLYHHIVATLDLASARYKALLAATESVERHAGRTTGEKIDDYEVCKDPATGRTYYFNTRTQTSSWTI